MPSSIHSVASVSERNQSAGQMPHCAQPQAGEGEPTFTLDPSALVPPRV
jgi:hypothetical protein